MRTKLNHFVIVIKPHLALSQILTIRILICFHTASNFSLKSKRSISINFRTLTLVSFPFSSFPFLKNREKYETKKRVKKNSKKREKPLICYLPSGSSSSSFTLVITLATNHCSRQHHLQPQLPSSSSSHQLHHLFRPSLQSSLSPSIHQQRNIPELQSQLPTFNPNPVTI